RSRTLHPANRQAGAARSPVWGMPHAVECCLWFARFSEPQPQRSDRVMAEDLVPPVGRPADFERPRAGAPGLAGRPSLSASGAARTATGVGAASRATKRARRSSGPAALSVGCGLAMSHGLPIGATSDIMLILVRCAYQIFGFAM